MSMGDELASYVRWGKWTAREEIEALRDERDVLREAMKQILAEVNVWVNYPVGGQSHTTYSHMMAIQRIAQTAWLAKTEGEHG